MLSKGTVLTDSLAILIEMENPHDDSSSSGFHYDVITRFQFCCLSITIHPLLSLSFAIFVDSPENGMLQQESRMR